MIFNFPETTIVAVTEQLEVFTNTPLAAILQASYDNLRRVGRNILSSIVLAIDNASEDEIVI